jgi:polo-like kinase 1
MPEAGTNGIVQKTSSTQRVGNNNNDPQTDKGNVNLKAVTTDRNKQFESNNSNKVIETNNPENNNMLLNNRPLTTNYLSNKKPNDPLTQNNLDTNTMNVNKGSTKTLTNDTKGKTLSGINPSTQGSLQGPDIWVKKWVDYSSKYGLGYLLSNNSTGVFFNDSSKIVLDIKAQTFNYIERRVSDKQELIYTHTLTDYPKEIQKKVTLLQHFRSYLEGDLNELNNDEVKIDEESSTTPRKTNNFVYVKKWMRTRHAIMFRLSNKIVQVCFQDHTEIILSSESRIVTYVNKVGDRQTYPLSSALESNNYEMTKRLKYTKDILTHMLTLNNNQNTNVGGSANTNTNRNSMEGPKFDDK